MRFSFRFTALAAACTCLLAVSTSFAAVTWDLNPTDANAPVGSSSFVYTSESHTITAFGFDNNNGAGTAHSLFFKNDGGDEIGLGLTGTDHNELQISNGTPLNFIQFDLRTILGQNAINGQIKVGSVQPSESFLLFGSNQLGTLGTQLGSAYDSAFDLQFINLPDFGKYNFYSVAAGADDVLPVALRAEFTPVPEMNALFPIVGLIAAVASTHALRRRKLARAVV